MDINVINALDRLFNKTPPSLYDLPRVEIVLDESKGYDFVFSHFFGVCVALEIENTGTTVLQYSIDSKDNVKHTLNPGSAKSYDTTTIKSLHVSSGSAFTVRAQLVPFRELYKVGWL